MTLKTLAAAACLSICAATAGLAATVTVTVDGIGYDVTTITGTFADNEALLKDQVWWGDVVLAAEFARSVSDRLGFPNDGRIDPRNGPVFAHSEDFLGGDFSGASIFERAFYPEHLLLWKSHPPFTFAIASPVSAVPLPAGGLLLVSAFGGIAALKRRKKGTA